MKLKYWVAIAAMLCVVACGEKKADVDLLQQSDKVLYELGTVNLESEDYDKARTAFKACIR